MYRCATLRYFSEINEVHSLFISPLYLKKFMVRRSISDFFTSFNEIEIVRSFNDT